MAALESLSDNYNIDIISASSVDFFFLPLVEIFMALCGVIFYCSGTLWVLWNSGSCSDSMENGNLF